ncbi:MAG: D-tyrosyl-tRNA(Tyr) deacylase [Pseudonocardia sp.]|nr:D-tyrosyl-tRNA(Tyr) deacylase [Pseudonocardia sp.]
MRAVAARVTRAAVRVDGEVVGEIDEPGLLVLLGVHRDDGPEQASTIARKLHELRVLRDDRSCASSGSPLLVVSQFTLYGETRKGRRPSWSAAAPPERAQVLVDAVVAALRERGARVATGRFGAMMAVESVNDGPFTVLVEVPPENGVVDG